PSSPSHVGSISNGDGGALLSGPYSVFVKDDYAYVASYGSNALEIIDVSTPSSPSHVGSISNGDGGALLSGPYSVFVKDDYAYVVSDTSNALEIIDVSTPSSPSHEGSISNGDGGALLSGPSWVFVKGDYAYVASYGSNALEIIDVSTPSSPSHEGSISNGDGGALLGGPISVFVKDNYAYIASYDLDALEIIDVSTPSSPSHVGSISDGDGGALLSEPYSVFVKDDYAYVVSDASDALEIIDTSNKAFRVFPFPPTTYYANINESYTDISNTGTSADPFNYDEFVSYINLNGYASASDVFKVQGYRIIEKPTSATVPWTPIQSDPVKRITIEDWNNLEYGPWMIGVTDYAASNNAILDFSYYILKNGIIYNKPYTINDNDIGGTIYVTYCYNMYIVNQGDNSLFYISPDNLNASAIKGSTIYSENGISDDDSNYSLIIEDSVLTGFTKNTYFTNASLYLYNNTYNQTSTTLNSDFTISITSGCQYEWTAPTNYPFTKDNDGYDETLNWLLNNKKILAPFSGINAPPNPGKNYRTYADYTTGEFGISRKDYRRS
ncbi:MAG: hypothetical protein GY849_21920, partial [Deltaproteobacteria bacterium]|nr:hypothetical protein [Deltaproteobacteria bacterium]